MTARAASDIEERLRARRANWDARVRAALTRAEQAASDVDERLRAADTRSTRRDPVERWAREAQVVALVVELGRALSWYLASARRGT